MELRLKSITAMQKRLHFQILKLDLDNSAQQCLARTILRDARFYVLAIYSTTKAISVPSSKPIRCVLIDIYLAFYYVCGDQQLINNFLVKL